MNSKNVLENIEPECEKFLGKKVKRFKSIRKPNNTESKNPPKISKSTLEQIEKVVHIKKIKLDKDGANSKISNISTFKESSKFKLPELSLKEQYQDLLKRINSSTEISSFTKKAKFFRRYFKYNE